MKSLIFVTGTLLVLLAAGVRPGSVPGLVQAEPTATPDRLAEPTLPAAPTEADQGAQRYWLHCMPCHGDHGQGLTVEFRTLYPPEDRNCWASGCHGNRPYEEGFTLPASVPRLIGPNALGNFATAGSLYAFIQAAMPFQAPGSLDETDYWEIIAFLLRENGIAYNPDQLDLANAQALNLHSVDGPGSDANSPVEAPAASGTPEISPNIEHNSDSQGGYPLAVFLLVGGLAILAVLIWIRRKWGGGGDIP